MSPYDEPDGTLQYRISEILASLPREETLPVIPADGPSATAVVVPIGFDSEGAPCLIFNKRSARVRQAGDLCFPGGSPEPTVDPILAAMLRLPGSPLRRWPHFRQWQNGSGFRHRHLSLMLAAALRESFEEMRLNPLSIRFLGPLPAQRLELFRRIIHPMVGWVKRRQRYRTNWEVERIVYIRIEDLLDPARYRRYRVVYAPSVSERIGRRSGEFPAYRHEGRRGVEILWGVTYRITAVFLRLAFQFTPPALQTLEQVDGFLDERYYDHTGFSPLP
jgi:8-oxo-dGTP pyrophosphatase MutT (NUDIX family)